MSQPCGMMSTVIGLIEVVPYKNAALTLLVMIENILLPRNFVWGHSLILDLVSALERLVAYKADI